MFANPQVETMDRAQLLLLQGQKLSKAVRWAQEKTAFFHESLARQGVSYTDIETAEDIRKLPFLTFNQLHAVPMLDFSTMPLSSMLRLSALRGRKGALTRLYTNGDIAHDIELVTRCLVSAGLHRAAVAGWLGSGADSRLLDIQYGLEFVGAAVVPMGDDCSAWQPLLEGSHLDTLAGAPARIRELENVLAAGGEDLSAYPVNRLILLHDSAASALAPLPKAWSSLKIYHLLALPEFGTPGIFLPCEAGRLAFHVAEDLYLAEILKADGSEAAAGETGELVLTSLEAQAMQLLRLRTGLMVRKLGACACGRTGLRVELTGISAAE